MKKLVISLPTIHCQSCVKLIDMTLKNVSGIENKEFDLEKKELYLDIETTVSGETIAQTILKETGYEAVVLSEEEERLPMPPEPVKIAEESPLEIVAQPKAPTVSKDTNASIAILNIEGMHCTSCSALIEKSLRHVAGVEEANVNFASEKARIKFDPKKANISELEKAVADAGYTAKVQ